MVCICGDGRGVCDGGGHACRGGWGCAAGETAVEAGGTHPTGMHSISVKFLIKISNANKRIYFRVEEETPYLNPSQRAAS